MRTPGAVALRTSAIDSATTSRPSGFSRVIPISVSVPNWISMGSPILRFSCNPFYAPGSVPKQSVRGSPWRPLNRRGLALLGHPIRREPDNVARIEIGQLEPVLCDIARREQVVFAIFLLQSVLQIRKRERRFCFLFD